MKRRVLGERGVEGWEGERKDFYVRKGWSLEDVEKLWEEGLMRGEELVEVARKKQREERRERIEEAKNNREYRFVKGSGVPEYLKKGWKEERWKRVTKFRLGEEMRGGLY